MSTKKKYKLCRHAILLAAMLGLASESALATGLLIPKDQNLPPLAIKYQRVAIDIKDSVATARIEQVFRNSANRDLEAVFVFPLPSDASISDFAMYINGKRMSGELLEKDKAHGIYQDIVRRAKDPGLLENMDGKLLRLSVYPVPANGDQKIEITYHQMLPFDAGLYKLVYLLRTGEKASRTLEDFTVSVRVNSTQPLKNIYSPSHNVGISRTSDYEAGIGFEQDRSLLDRDFVLYYSLAQKDFGLNLLTHARKGQDGMFLMMIAPPVEPKKDQVMEKDVVFVFDTSGSMSGRKMDQARSALTYCVEQLNPGDRFNIVRFSTDVEVLAKQLEPANSRTKKAAVAFVADLYARGGTDIHSALQTALTLPHDAKRSRFIIFLTDGKPTIGTTDAQEILNHATKGAGETRIFVFGVGHKVNTHLLDQIAGRCGGVCKYVEPEEDIEVKVSSLFDKISHPVLAAPRIEVDRIELRQVHPRVLPDLFYGDQLIVLGRYRGHGDSAIRLHGTVNGEPRTLVFEGSFAAKQADNAFIPRLWATRRIGYLLDEIRLQGEQAELKDEVLQLSKEYGIMTPYTSFLVVEDEAEPAPLTPLTMHTPRRGTKAAQPEPGNWVELKRKEDSRHRRGHDMNILEGASPTKPAAVIPVFASDAAKMDALQSESGATREYFRQDSGKEAVQLSQAIQDYKNQSTAVEDIATIRHVAGKIFHLIHGVWIDKAYKEDMPVKTVTFGSDAYFKLLKKHPELKPYLALGEKVIVVLDKKRVFIVE